MRKVLNFIYTIIVLAVVIAIGIAVFIPGMYVKEESAIRALETNGFSDVEITDKAVVSVDWRGCAKDDDARYTAKATNPAGQRVEVYVCAAWPFKAPTIRAK